jgi:DNA-binding MarR family transcriptional regulator
MARRRSVPKSSSTKEQRPPDGYFAYDGLDRVLHEKARLGILTALLTRPAGLVFVDLRELCALTDGNLSRHIQVLQESGLVEVWKGSDGSRPQTLVRLTRGGRAQFVAYLDELERVIRDARTAPDPEGRDVDPAAGWVPA